MRGVFGLLSVLICGLIVAYLWAMHTAAVSKSGNQAKDTATQLSGHDANGKSALESIKTEPETAPGGHLKCLVVTDVTPGGAMEQYYGFKKGDKIISEGDYDVTADGDAGTASAMLLDAFEKFKQVDVIRDGKQIKLPPEGSGKSFQEQMNQLQRSGGH